jgi:uncharacterized membrane protein (DUF106 family)
MRATTVAALLLLALAVMVAAPVVAQSTSTTTTSTTTPLTGKIMPPMSTLILTLTAVGFTLVSNVMIRKFVDLKAERRARAEYSEWQKLLKEAIRKKDKKEEEKLKKKQQTMQTMQAKASFARMKVSLYTIVPFFIIYGLLLSFLGNVAGAWSPFYIPYLMTSVQFKGGYEVSTFGWYIISSFSFSGLLMRLLKTTT